MKNNETRRWLGFKQGLFWIGLVAVVMLPRLLTLDIFVGPDELAELGRDNNFTLALASGDLAGTLVGDGKPSVTLMWINTLGVTSQWLWLQLGEAPPTFEQVVAPERPFSVWPERRLFLAFVSGLQILAMAPLLQRIWNRQIAVLAVVLMALEPFLLAFTRIIRGDALLAGFMILSLLGALAFLKTGRQAYNGFSGVMAGLAGLTKLSGGAIVIIIVLLYGAALFKKDKGQGEAGFRSHPSAFVFWLLAAAITFFGLWPAWWFRPLETFVLLWDKGFFHTVEATTQQANLYFWGAVHPFGPGLWFYPVLAALRLTPWLLLGTLMALGRWLGATFRRRAIPDLKVLGLLIYLVIYGLVISIPGQKLDRFLMPIVPALAILTALEAHRLILWLSESLGRRSTVTSYLPPLITALLGLALGWQVSRYHPLYSTYFNPISGSPPFWQWALPIGHGEGVDSALLHLSQQGDMGDKTLVCGTNLPRCQPFFKGKLLSQDALRSGAWFKADYVLWHVDEQQMEEFPAQVLAYLRRQPPRYVAHYHGLDYTWLYPVPRPEFLVSNARLEGVARLFGYDAGGQNLNQLAPGDTLKLHVYWQNEGQAHQQQFWWRVMGRNGYSWSEATTQPLSTFQTEAAQKGAIVEGTVTLSLPPDMPPGPYRLQAGFANASGDVGQFPGKTLNVSGLPSSPTPPDQVLNRQVAPHLHLRGYQISPTEVLPGETVWLSLHWQATGAIGQDYTLRLQLVDPARKLLEAWPTVPPVSIHYPTSAWPADSHVRGAHALTVPVAAAPGPYQLELMRHDQAAAEPLKIGVINIVSRKVSFEAPPMQFPAQATFGSVVTLLGYDLAGNLSTEAARVTVTLYWQAQTQPLQRYRVKLRLVDSRSGELLAEQTAEPAEGNAITTDWQTGEVIADRHELELPNSQAVSVNLEIQLLAHTFQPIPLTNGQPAFVVPDMQQRVSWRVQ